MENGTLVYDNLTIINQQDGVWGYHIYVSEGGNDTAEQELQTNTSGWLGEGISSIAKSIVNKRTLHGPYTLQNPSDGQNAGAEVNIGIETLLKELVGSSTENDFSIPAENYYIFARTCDANGNEISCDSLSRIWVVSY